MIINKKTIDKLNTVERYTINHFLDEILKEDSLKGIKREGRLSTILDKKIKEIDETYFHYDFDSMGQLNFIDSLETDSYRCKFKMLDSQQFFAYEYCKKEMHLSLVYNKLMNKLK